MKKNLFKIQYLYVSEEGSINMKQVYNSFYISFLKLGCFYRLRLSSNKTPYHSILIPILLHLYWPCHECWNHQELWKLNWTLLWWFFTYLLTLHLSFIFPWYKLHLREAGRSPMVCPLCIWGITNNFMH